MPEKSSVRGCPVISYEIPNDITIPLVRTLAYSIIEVERINTIASCRHPREIVNKLLNQ